MKLLVLRHEGVTHLMIDGALTPDL